MMDSTLAVLEEALAFGDTIVIVRSGAPKSTRSAFATPTATTPLSTF